MQRAWLSGWVPYPAAGVCLTPFLAPAPSARDPLVSQPGLQVEAL